MTGQELIEAAIGSLFVKLHLLKAELDEAQKRIAELEKENMRLQSEPAS